MTTRWLLMLGALLLAGCAEPLPPDRVDYAGLWHAPGFELLISTEGRVDYERQTDVRTNISGPIQEFDGDSFKVGIGIVSTTFVVSRPPRQVDGVWTIVVDGVEPTRLQ